MSIQENMDIKDWLKASWKKIAISIPSMLLSLVFRQYREAIVVVVIGMVTAIIAYIKGMSLSILSVCVGVGIACGYFVLFAFLRKFLRDKYNKAQLTLWQKQMICYLGDISNYSAPYKQMRDDLDVKPKGEPYFLAEMRRLEWINMLEYADKWVKLSSKGLRLYDEFVNERFCEEQEYVRFSDNSN